MTVAICPHCNHVREPDAKTEAWVCPACGKKYYEAAQKPGALKRGIAWMLGGKEWNTLSKGQKSLAVGIYVAVAWAMLAAPGKHDKVNARNTPSALVTSYTVKYVVEGPSEGMPGFLVRRNAQGEEVAVERTTLPWRASLTYRNSQGGTEQEGDVRLPWSRTLIMSPGDFLYISAQNSENYGGVTVRIFVDDIPFKESSSSGGYSIASASGNCCSRK